MFTPPLPRAPLPGFLLFALPTFLAGFLVFAVEPMVAKWLLPAFGGSPATWSACLVSFQLLLLAGYAYAFASVRWLSQSRQASAHLSLLAGSALVVCWAGPSAAPVFGRSPVLSISFSVLGRVGIPYLVLASSAPLLSSWSARWRPGRPLTSLYAVSNAGALAGLAAYPFVIEPNLDVDRQFSVFRGAFLAFGIAMAGAALRCAASGSRLEASPSPAPTRTIAERARWLAYAFVPSVMLLAATNHITVDVAAMPLFWVVPLVLYIVSFIVAFSPSGGGFRGLVLPFWIFGALGLAVNAHSEATSSLPRQLVATLVSLFAASLLCHGELARDRPTETELPGYYLIIALGGALGGAFVSFVAPVVFVDYYELELGAIATFVVLVVAARTTAHDPWPRAHRLGLLLGCGLCLPFLASSGLLRLRSETRDGRVVERRRSFLGPYRVIDVAEGRLLTHGRIQHGMELRGADRRMPTMYYGPGTALARVMRALPGERPRRIGVVGLGVGTIAAYGRPGDSISFYELDANVVDVARRDFTFLADSEAHIDVVVGDGRIALSREPPRGFDVLVLDAFSSDAVPVHLLTREAFAVYSKHLAPDGLLLANVSNRYLSVDRVVLGSAEALDLASAFIETPTDLAHHVSHVEWAIMARDLEVLARRLGTALPRTAPARPAVLWTDTRASVLSILRAARPGANGGTSPRGVD